MHERKWKNYLNFSSAQIKYYLFTACCDSFDQRELWHLFYVGTVSAQDPWVKRIIFQLHWFFVAKQMFDVLSLLSCAMRLFDPVLNKDLLWLFNQSSGSTELRDAFVF